MQSNKKISMRATHKRIRDGHWGLYFSERPTYASSNVSTVKSQLVHRRLSHTRVFVLVVWPHGALDDPKCATVHFLRPRLTARPLVAVPAVAAALGVTAAVSSGQSESNISSILSIPPKLVFYSHMNKFSDNRTHTVPWWSKPTALSSAEPGQGLHLLSSLRAWIQLGVLQKVLDRSWHPPPRSVMNQCRPYSSARPVCFGILSTVYDDRALYKVASRPLELGIPIGQ